MHEPLPSQTSVRHIANQISDAASRYPFDELAQSGDALQRAADLVASVDSGHLTEVHTALSAANNSLRAAAGYLDASANGLAAYLQQIGSDRQLPGYPPVVSPTLATAGPSAAATQFTAQTQVTPAPPQRQRKQLPPPEFDAEYDTPPASPTTLKMLGSVALSAFSALGSKSEETIERIVNNLSGKRGEPLATERQRFRLRDKYLRTYFPDAVEGLDIDELFVIQPGRKPPRSLQQFRLIPIVASRRGVRTSLTGTASHVKVPPDIRTTYHSPGGKPYLDTSLAIGLVRGDWLVAIAGGGLDGYGQLKIVQIQDVSGTNSEDATGDPRQRFRTGLHDGFLWRDTLVNAWEEIGRNMRVSDRLVIQGGKNNEWFTINRHPHHPAYDGVAERMGFEKGPDGNWTRPIADVQLIYRGRISTKATH